MKIAFIGGGVMAEAMLSAILKTLPAPHTISISDISDTRRLYIEQKYIQEQEYGKKFSMTVVSSNQLAAKEADVVVLCIKPQNLV